MNCALGEGDELMSSKALKESKFYRQRTEEKMAIGNKIPKYSIAKGLESTLFTDKVINPRSPSISEEQPFLKPVEEV